MKRVAHVEGMEVSENVREKGVFGLGEKEI
jgi:hypothetical protein